MSKHPPRPVVNYFLLQPRSRAEQLGGTGIFLQSRLNYLRSLGDRIRLRVVPVRDAGENKSTWPSRVLALLHYVVRELGLLVGQPGDMYYLVYPKVPMVAYGVSFWTWPFALLGYALLWLRRKVTGLRVVIEIEDLPIERNHLGVSSRAPDLSSCLWRHLNRWERMHTILEWVIFHSAGRILHPSQPFSDHVAAKFGLPQQRMGLYRREIYMPTYEDEVRIGRLPDLREMNFFYSAGSLAEGFRGANLETVVDAFADLPDAALYLCGRDGEWIEARCQERAQSNVHYLGLLSYADHDAAARQCQVGLLLYTNSYDDFKCTAKYPAYVANGMAVLSTDLLYLSRIIEEDKVGQALPMDQLVTELCHWAKWPEIIKPYRQQAHQLAPRYLDGTYMAEWFIPEIER